VRTAPERFLIRPNHNRPEVEHVVDQHPGYWVGEKYGEAADHARDTDARSSHTAHKSA
jgi:hypothetical protein